MEQTSLKYTLIKSRDQYDKYCDQLENIVMQGDDNLQDEIDLLTLLIEKYDDEHSTLKESDPITLLKLLMQDHRLKAQDMTAILGISKGYISDILNYKKGLSKDVIRKLADHFKVRQEAFNRPYKLVSPVNAHLRNASVMNTTKQLNYA
ncbi:type II toxin-antitoxin system HigA family antitoxin [Mucilaginibacter sp. L3T2-6]|uniref:helix-turn-helix domain-containing protein n=1 Tax=Mucilaginibacter sp. L3T2-6 TaxID=3062491 RepID=UPI002674CACD|nr:helix-turn-helix domain-containing protein [Mucilaginibacter sp. L3T2-6]MDO3642092.1 helix-turn-helix domain-containing protein [Mucilaginibacter sp. L3T2-6]MDV6214586.1 helix-turn-helix domain-containing protein [Mucilaginibacter sp. L3T2-6]